MERIIKIANKEINLEQGPYLMGILNVTPDSFSDGNLFKQTNKALDHVEKMIEEGAVIIDVGGESTRPGHVRISDEEELERVCTIIEKIKARFDTIVSIDTYKSKVAKGAFEAGADMLNDIWGLKADKDMAKIAKEYNVTVCLMDNSETVKRDPGVMGEDQMIQAVINELQSSIKLATDAGISREKLIIDPGIGFAKTYEGNLCLIRRLEELKVLDLPILLAASRKSVIGLTLDLPVDQREEGTIVTSVLGTLKGCSFLRVHDVKGNLRAIQMTKALR